jgi:hypothetical protein
MSGIRKYSRYKTAHDNHKKTVTKITLWEVLMIAGGAMLIIGVLGGVFSYTTYTAGRSEQIRDSIIGRIYLPETAPGDPGQKFYAYCSMAAAIIGSLLLVVSVPGYVIGRRRCRADDVTISL